MRRKLRNRIDHVVYLSRWERVDENVAALEAITDATPVRCERADMGCVICVDWSAGLEIVAPLPDRAAVNEALHQRLDTHGEGLLAVVFGVPDLEAKRADLAAKGIETGPLMSGDPIEPWFERLLLRERFAPPVVNDWLVLSQIDYDADLLGVDDVPEA